MLLRLLSKQIMVVGESQFTGNDFCKYPGDFQGHEVMRVGLVGMELDNKSRCL